MENTKKELENIFRESTSSDELFDAFQKSIQLKIIDLTLYKILLGNVVLSSDEIKMFTEKICAEFPDLSADICLWTGSILESDPTTNNLDAAFEYYKKAIWIKPEDYQPYISIIKMYNNDLDFPPRRFIESVFEKGLLEVKLKSNLCKAIVNFYDCIDEPALRKKYQHLVSFYAQKEKQL